MKVYLAPDAPIGQRWHPTQADAKRAAGRRGNIVEQIVGENGRAGMCDLLNLSELRGRDAMEPSSTDLIAQTNDAPVGSQAAAGQTPSYTEWSIATDEEFDRLPIARQLDLAGRAMENARSAL